MTGSAVGKRSGILPRLTADRSHESLRILRSHGASRAKRAAYVATIPPKMLPAITSLTK